MIRVILLAGLCLPGCFDPPLHPEAEELVERAKQKPKPKAEPKPKSTRPSSAEGPQHRSWDARLDLFLRSGPHLQQITSIYAEVLAERRDGGLRIFVQGPRRRGQRPGPELALHATAEQLKAGTVWPESGSSAALHLVGNGLVTALQREGDAPLRTEAAEDGRTLLRGGPPALLDRAGAPVPLEVFVEWGEHPLPVSLRLRRRLAGEEARALLSALGVKGGGVLTVHLSLRPPSPPPRVRSEVDALRPFRDALDCFSPVERGPLRLLSDFAKGRRQDKRAVKRVKKMLEGCAPQLEAFLGLEREVSQPLQTRTPPPSRALRQSGAFRPLPLMAAAQVRARLETPREALRACVETVRALDLLARGAAGQAVEFAPLVSPLRQACSDAVGGARDYRAAERDLEMARDWRRPGLRSVPEADRRHLVAGLADLLLRLIDATEAARRAEAPAVVLRVERGQLRLERSKPGVYRLATRRTLLPAKRSKGKPAQVARHGWPRTAKALAKAGYAWETRLWRRGPLQVELRADGRRAGLYLLRGAGATRNLVAFLPAETQAELAALPMKPDPRWPARLELRAAGWPVPLAPRAEGPGQGHLSNGAHLYIEVPDADAETKVDALVAEGLATALRHAQRDLAMGQVGTGRDAVHTPLGVVLGAEGMARLP